METYKKQSEEPSDNCVTDCHCSVCFALINDVAAARHTSAGRYYCKRCRSAFRTEELGTSDSSKS